MSLGEGHREELYACAYRILLGAALNITTQQQMSDAVQSVRSVVYEAGADAAQAWNRRQRSSISQRLPPEVLGNCFRMLCFGDLVRITHVCRHWRTVALGERELWAMYSRGFTWFSANGLAQLDAVLERSRPVPFRLRIAYTFSCIDESLLVARIRPEMWRMREYLGPARIFLAASSDVVAMKFLESFDCDEGHHTAAPFFLPDFLADAGAPKLQSIRVPFLSLEGVSATFRSLRSLSISDSAAANISTLFKHCPGLVSLHLLGIEQSSVLPQCPLPASLRTVCLFGDYLSDIDYTPILEPWIGQSLPFLCVDITSLYRPSLRMFLASHEHDVHVHIQSTRICFTCDADADRRYEIRDLHDDLGAQKLKEDRITALSLSVGMLPGFFGVRHRLPFLASFDLIVDSEPDDELPTGEQQRKTYYLKAPRLRHFAVAVVLPDDWLVAHVAKYFLERLRSWLRYDAPPLDSITVRGDPSCVEQHITPLDLGRLATRYVVETTESAHIHEFPSWPDPPPRIVRAVSLEA